MPIDTIRLVCSFNSATLVLLCACISLDTHNDKDSSTIRCILRMQYSAAVISKSARDSVVMSIKCCLASHNALHAAVFHVHAFAILFVWFLHAAVSTIFIALRYAMICSIDIRSTYGASDTVILSMGMEGSERKGMANQRR